MSMSSRSEGARKNSVFAYGPGLHWVSEVTTMIEPRLCDRRDIVPGYFDLKNCYP